MLAAFVVAIAYFLGSLPFGYLIVRAKVGSDVRRAGSGGTGATNVSRQAGERAGIITLVLDAMKGFVAIMLARWLLTPDFGMNWWVATAAVAVIVGHMFPVWLGFRGGKGVATGLGVFLNLAPVAVMCVALIFIIVVWATRFISLGSMIASAALPLCIWLLSVWREPKLDLAPVIAAATTGGALIILMHRANIKRLWRGTENKFRPIELNEE